MRLQKVLSEKKNNETVYSVVESATIIEAAKIMSENNIGALLVLADENNPKSYAGILTERIIISECWKHENFRQMKV